MTDNIIANRQMHLSSEEDSCQMPINKKNESLEKFEKELLGLYEKIEGEDVDAVVEAVKNSYKKFCDRVDKSEFKKEIVEWFDNNCEVIEDRKRSGIGLLNDRMIQELFLSIMGSLIIEPDSEFYKFLDDEFGAIMY